MTPGGTAVTSVTASGLQTPKFSTAIPLENEKSVGTSNDNKIELLADSFEFPAPPSLPIEVRNKMISNS